MDVLLSERTKNHWENVDANEFGRFGCFGAFASRPRFPEVLRGSWMSWILVIKNIKYNISKNLNNIYYKTFTAKEC